MGRSVSWRAVAASCAGSSHIARGLACDDRGAVLPLDDDTLAIVVADGAGSAACGAQGAALAVAAVASTLQARHARGEALTGPDCAADLLAAARDAVQAQAQPAARPLRDYASTLLTLVADRARTLLLQIGDGAAAIDVGEGFVLPIAPMNGEYANMTRFFTDDDAAEQLAVRVIAQPLARAVVFTDGLQRLLIDLAALQPHAPALERLIAPLSHPAADDASALQAALARFLDSAAVNARTDDDKTLALAIRLT